MSRSTSSKSIKDRRSTFPSAIAALNVLPTVESDPASPAASSSPATSVHQNASRPSSGTSSPVTSLPPTDPATPAQSSFPSTSTSLAQFIQQKRRQASAPYFASARSQSLFSPGAGFSLGPSSTNAGAGPSGYSGSWGSGAGGTRAAGEIEAGASQISPRLASASLPPSRNRSRASSRRATATGGVLSLQTFGLSAPFSEAHGLEDSGLVPTPTTEEWRVLGSELSELASMRAREEKGRMECEAEKGEAGAAEPDEEQRKPRWKRWPSLQDDASSDDEEDNFALSLSLSKYGKYKHGHQLPHTPPDRSRSNSPSNKPKDDAHPSRPAPSTYKSSFSYTSTGSGVTGGFTSHSNTNSISSITGTHPVRSPLTDPLPSIDTFEPTHRKGQKSDPSLALSHVTAESTSTHQRPALSRGSLSSATGSLSSTSPPRSLDSSTNGTATPASTEDSDRTVELAQPRPTKPHGLPSLPLPPSVFRSLEEGEPSLRDTGLATPPSVAATPFDGDPFASTAPASASLPPTPYIAPPSGDDSQDVAGRSGAAVDLDWTKPLGPVDPRTYSAVTGARDIRSFVCDEEEAGKGAYGSVRRAREKGKDGKPVGPELIIKYVIKQRILADCWKKHKILGPIPIEVHVLDHLRRVPYEPRPRLNFLSKRRGRNGTITKKGTPVRRDSAPKLDLWTGGKDGGVVQTGHPNICPLLDYWEDSEFYFLVMPQATASPTSDPDSHPRHGQDLFDYVDAHPDGLPPRDIHRILSQVADAVWFLHEHQIVHRDIKDENVTLDADGNVRLIDFGSAAYVKEGRKFDTFSGTLDFAAPEVLKGARYGGKEQDIWALGVLGYVLICGECPFWSPDEAMQGISSDTRAYAAMRSKISSSTSSSASSSSSTSDEPSTFSVADAVDLVMRCLEIDPANRPSADMICDHAFLVGQKEGWRGSRGWVNPRDEAEEAED
ncbi:serine/threonine protein kinase [Rhodotorula toruloides]